MKYNEYKNIFKETAVYPKKVDNFDLAYLWYGLGDEYQEFIDTLSFGYNKENALKEHGDILWYVTGLCEIFNINGSLVFYKDLSDNTTKTSNEIVADILRYGGKIKKYYRDDKAIDIIELRTILEDIVSSANILLEKWTGYNISYSMSKNYQKLFDRKNRGVLKGDGDNR